MASNRFWRGRKRRELTPLLILLFLSPYLIGWSPDPDSVYTYSSLQIGAGTGQYAYQDCSGTHTSTINEAGATLTHKFEAPVRIGATGTFFRDGESVAIFAFPDVALDWREFSIGTTGLRLGRTDRFFFDIGGLEGAPLLTGRGVLRTGFGGAFGEDQQRYYVGVNVFPYHEPGVVMQYGIPLQKDRYLSLTGRYGNGLGKREYGFSLSFLWMDL